MIGVGFAAGRLKIIKQETTEGLTKIVFNVSVPCLIIANMVTTYKREMLLSTAALPLFAFILILLVNFPLAYFSAKIFKIKKEEEKQYLFLNMFPNYYYISIPLAGMLYGPAGVLYVFLFGFMADIFLWTIGVGMFCNKENKGKFPVKSILNPGIVALLAGFVLSMARVNLPAVVFTPLQVVGSITTPMAMLITGAILANIKLEGVGKLFVSKDMFLIVFIRIILAPLIIIFLTMFFNLDPVVRAIIVLQAAMPSGFSAILFATQYKKDPNYSAAACLVTTGISMVTLPLFLYIIR